MSAGVDAWLADDVVRALRDLFHDAGRQGSVAGANADSLLIRKESHSVLGAANVVRFESSMMPSDCKQSRLGSSIRTEDVY